MKPLLGIVGTGMIGASLAALFTGNGYPTVIYATSPEKIAVCRSRYDAYFADLIQRGLITAEQAEICGGYLQISCDFEDFADAVYVFEAVTELLHKKHEVYAQLERYCKRLEVLASTTSAFSSEDLTAGLTLFKDRFLIAHPFNPPHIVLYFELVRPMGTQEAAMTNTVALLEQMERKVICLKKPVPGCIGNRLQYALLREAVSLVEQGVATPEDIDAALQYSFAPRYTKIGLFEHLDNAGLDLFQTACNTLYPTLCNAVEAPPIINEKARENALGCKSGKGFYLWDDGSIADMRQRAMEPYYATFCWNLPEEPHEQEGSP